MTRADGLQTGDASDDPASVPSLAELIERIDPQRARLAIAGDAVRTPTIASDELSAELAGHRSR